MAFGYVSGGYADISENVIVLGTFVGGDVGDSAGANNKDIVHLIWILSYLVFYIEEFKSGVFKDY